MQEINKQAFAADLINWYKENKRDLPWRLNKDPYRIWVSEIMLQQTQVATVIPYYLNFMSIFPTVFELAHSDLEKVYKAWEGLGYYSRARNLHETAKVIVEKYSGIFPMEYKDLLSLKGIGTYTAGAISSIAYNKISPAVDGNVMRVMSRVLSIWDDLAISHTKKKFEVIMEQFIPEENPSMYNQGLMELGALICKPKGQKCLQCPVHSHCSAFINGYDDELPIKTTKAKQQKQLMITGIIENNENQYLLRKRPEHGLLAGLWEFVQVDGHIFEDLQLHLQNHYHLRIEGGKEIDTLKHVFSHRIWVMTIFHAKVTTKMILPSHLKWMRKEDVLKVPVSIAHKKIFNYLE